LLLGAIVASMLQVARNGVFGAARAVMVDGADRLLVPSLFITVVATFACNHC